MQIVITRENAAIPWGFRLKGGAEYNVPLSILKVNDGSPSHRKLEVGDVIANIGNYPALSLNHEDALNIIRQFDLNLPLVIQREQNQFSSVSRPMQAKPSAVWRPPSVSNYELNTSNSSPISSPQSYYNQNQNQNSLLTSARNMNNNNNQSYNQNQIPYGQFQQPQPQSQFSPRSPHHQKSSSFFNQDFNQPLTVQPSQPQQQQQHQPPPFIPPPPPPMNNYSNNQEQTTNKPWQSSYDLKPVSVSSPSSFKSQLDSGNPVPDALLKSMMGSGKKPFTYTPGGLDLSHVKNSLRVKRHDHTGNSSPSHQHQQQQQFHPHQQPHQQHHQQPHHQPQHQPHHQPHHQPQPQIFNFSNYQNNNNINTQDGYRGPISSFGGDGDVPVTILRPEVKPLNTSMYNGPISSFGGGDEIQYASPLSLQGPIPASPSFLVNPVMPTTPISRTPSILRQNSFTSSNTSSPKRVQPITYQPSKSQGNSVIFQASVLTPEQLATAKASTKSENKNELMNQSFSFRMLNKWIEDSESKIIPMKSKRDEEEERLKEHEDKNSMKKKSHVIQAIEEEESRFTINNSFKQRKNSVTNSNSNSNSHSIKTVSVGNQPASYSVPSKTFQYVDRKYSVTEDDINQQMYASNRKQSFSEEQQYPKGAPARERIQENGPSKYKGSHIPSKAFSYLQYLTQNDSVVSNNANNSSSFSANPPQQPPLMPQPSSSSSFSSSNLEIASVQTYSDNNKLENKKNSLNMQMNYSSNNNNASSFPSLNNNVTFKQPQACQVIEVNNKVETPAVVESFENENIADIQTVPESVSEPVQEPELELETEQKPEIEQEPEQKSESEHFIDYTLTEPELPAESPCLDSEPIAALTFSNNEIINESINLNDNISKESSNISKTNEELTQIGSAIETLDQVITQEEESATKNKAQEIVIETSEF